ncbi:hypothetical protein [Kribbella sp. NPDC006257]|uniref:hypothetical protein n=1 Tax=Kribbella sp. NPDC006257 TaxID=3156738 RepID=UPI0033BF164C
MVELGAGLLIEIGTSQGLLGDRESGRRRSRVTLIDRWTQAMLGEVPELRSRRRGIGNGRAEPSQALGQSSKYRFGRVGLAAEDARPPTLDTRQ